MFYAGADEVAAASVFLLTQMLTNPDPDMSALMYDFATALQDQGSISPRVYDSQAPAGSPLPYVVYQFYSSQDVRPQGGPRIQSRPAFLMKVVGGDDSFSVISNVYRMVDALISERSGYVTVNNLQYWISGCFREQQYQRQLDVNETRYNEIGGRYRLYVQQWPPAGQ